MDKTARKLEDNIGRVRPDNIVKKKNFNESCINVTTFIIIYTLKIKDTEVRNHKSIQRCYYLRSMCQILVPIIGIFIIIVLVHKRQGRSTTLL